MATNIDPSILEQLGIPPQRDEAVAALLVASGLARAAQTPAPVNLPRPAQPRQMYVTESDVFDTIMNAIGEGNAAINPAAIPGSSDADAVSALAASIGTPSGQASVQEPRSYTPVATGRGGVPITDADRAFATKNVGKINANTPETGVRGFIDEKGVLNITNIGPDGKPIAPLSKQEQQTGAVPTTTDKQMSGGIRGIVDQLRNTTDAAAGRGLIATLNEALASETARITAESQKLAEQKLGIPLLEQRLAEAIAADQADPMYKVGMGDSPITAGIRTQLNTARSAADAETKRMLDTNVGFASIKAAAVTAQAEQGRLERLDATRQQTAANAEVRKELRKEEREEILREKAAGLTDTVKENLTILQPALLTSPDKNIDMVRTYERGLSNKEFKAAVDASNDRLLPLAASGNGFATQLLAAKENALTGRSEEETKALVKKMNSYANSSAAMTKGLELLMPGNTKEAKQARDQMRSDLTAKSVGTAEQKAEASVARMEIAKKMVVAELTNNFRSNVESWGITDPEILAAIATTKGLTKTTRLDDVLTTYIGDSTGAEAVAKATKLKAAMRSAAQKNSQSLIGMVEYRNIETEIDRSTLSKGILPPVMDAINQFSTGLPFPLQSPLDMVSRAPDSNRVRAVSHFLFGE